MIEQYEVSINGPKIDDIREFSTLEAAQREYNALVKEYANKAGGRRYEIKLMQMVEEDYYDMLESWPEVE